MGDKLPADSGDEKSTCVRIIEQSISDYIDEQTAIPGSQIAMSLQRAREYEAWRDAQNELETPPLLRDWRRLR